AVNDEMVKSKKGFTLAELLIVVAIIAVLVAISIPVFTSQLKKARLAVDHSAMRDAYALAQVANNLQEIEIEWTAYSFDD
ncbi:type IV pilin protein, partial [Salmonella enterica]|uniref:type IV pilin protein n=1 Tax=Salmonella enterica TaxID=28901 RepID=UPI003CF7E48A